MDATTKACIPNADTDAIGDDMALDKDTAGQLTAVHVALPNLDPKDVSNPKAPIQHLNRRDRDGFMPYTAEDGTYHGDGAWRWRKGRTDRGSSEAEALESEDTDGYTTPVHEPSTSIAPPKLIRHTRSQSQWRDTVSGTDCDLPAAVAASLQTGSLEPAALKPCRKRKGSSLLAARVVRECQPQQVPQPIFYQSGCMLESVANSWPLGWVRHLKRPPCGGVHLLRRPLSCSKKIKIWPRTGISFSHRLFLSLSLSLSSGGVRTEEMNLCRR